MGNTWPWGSGARVGVGAALLAVVVVVGSFGGVDVGVLHALRNIEQPAAPSARPVASRTRDAMLNESAHTLFILDASGPVSCAAKRAA
ncbi:MAG: hypothetical protein AB7G11_12300 [Phycisphaerales bacterium]